MSAALGELRREAGRCVRCGRSHQGLGHTGSQAASRDGQADHRHSGQEEPTHERRRVANYRLIAVVTVRGNCGFLMVAQPVGCELVLVFSAIYCRDFCCLGVVVGHRACCLLAHLHICEHATGALCMLSVLHNVTQIVNVFVPSAVN